MKKPTDADYERAARTVRDMIDARERPKQPRKKRGPKPPPWRNVPAGRRRH